MPRFYRHIVPPILNPHIVKLFWKSYLKFMNSTNIRADVAQGTVYSKTLKPIRVIE